MTKVMMICPFNGKPVFTGIDIPDSQPLRVFADRSMECPNCRRRHRLKNLYFENTAPTELDRYYVALDSAPDFASEIGILISCFALIESYLPKLLSLLTGLTYEDSLIITGRFQVGDRVQLLQALAKLRSDQDVNRQAIEILIVDLIDAVASRNRYAHSQYAITFNDDIVVTSWLWDSKRKNKSEKTETLESLTGEVRKFKALICKLHAFVHRHEMPTP